MANDTVGTDWASELVKRIGAAVKSARKGKSAAWLSDRTHELGYRISPTVIAKLDSGHRGGVLSIAELLILAAALELPPLALLFPNVLDDVEVLPGNSIRGLAAVGWFMGAGYEYGLFYDVSYVPQGVAPSDLMRIPLRLLRIEETLAQQRHSLLQSEGGPEVFVMMSETERASAKRHAEITRETIKVLEQERDWLIAEYRKAAEANA